MELNKNNFENINIKEFQKELKKYEKKYSALLNADGLIPYEEQEKIKTIKETKRLLKEIKDNKKIDTIKRIKSNFEKLLSLEENNKNGIESLLGI